MLIIYSCHSSSGLLTGRQVDDGVDEPDDLKEEGYYSYIKVTPLQSIFSYKNATGTGTFSIKLYGRLKAIVFT